MRPFTILVAALPLAFAVPTTSPALVPTRYIVKFKSGLLATLIQAILQTVTSTVDAVYDLDGFQAFSSALSQSDLQKLLNSPFVSLTVLAKDFANRATTGPIR